MCPSCQCVNFLANHQDLLFSNLLFSVIDICNCSFMIINHIILLQLKMKVILRKLYTNFSISPSKLLQCKTFKDVCQHGLQVLSSLLTTRLLVKNQRTTNRLYLFDAKNNHMLSERCSYSFKILQILSLLIML